MRCKLLLFTICCIASSLGSLKAAEKDWTLLANFDKENNGSENWDVRTHGKVSFEYVARGENKALKLIAPKVKDKLIRLVFKNPPQPVHGGYLHLAFDMKIDTSGAPGSYRSGVWFGKNPGFLMAGQFGACNGKGPIRAFYLGEQTDRIKRTEKWYHYVLSVGRGRAIVKIYETDQNAVSTPDTYDKPIAEYSSACGLADAGNQLYFSVYSPTQVDYYGQARGALLVDNVFFRTEAGENTPQKTFKSGAVTFGLNSRTGALGNVKIGAQDYISESTDSYSIDSPNGKKETFESDDKMLDLKVDEDKSIWTTVCSNPSLPNIRIEKKYTVTSEDIRKTVSFIPDNDKKEFITYRCGLRLSKEYRTGSYYETLRGWDVPAILPAEKITSDRRLGNPAADWCARLISACRDDLYLGMTHFAWAEDGKYIWPIAQMQGEATYYTADGWRFPAFAFVPKKNIRRSFTSRILFYRGSHLDFYSLYRDFDEVKECLAKKDSDWTENVKFDFVCWCADTVKTARLGKALLDAGRYSENEYGMMTLWGWTQWGDFPTTDEEKVVLTTAKAKYDKCPPQVLANQFASIRKEAPEIKLGLYQLFWSLSDKMVKKHPDWTAHRKDGTPMPMRTEPGWTPYYRTLAGQGSYAGIIDGMRRMKERFEPDFFYLDGGVRGQVRPDWRQMRVETTSNWLELWSDIYKLSRSGEKHCSVFANNPFPLFSDAGYSENSAFGKSHGENWPALTDVYSVIKLLNPEGRYLGALYRTSQGKSNEPHYTNMLLAAGLQPAMSRDPNIVPDWKQLPGYLPWINAAFEIRNTRLINCIEAPRYYAPQAEAQALPLKLGDALLVSLLRQKEGAGDTIVRIDRAKSQLPKDGPLHVWKVSVEPAHITESEPIRPGTGRLDLPKVVKTKYLGTRSFPSDLIEETVSLEFGKLEYLVFSSQGAVINSVNGYPTQFELPTLLGTSVSAKDTGNSIELAINSKFKSTSITVPLPDWAAKGRITSQPQVKTETFTEGQHKFAKLVVPEGIDSIVLHPAGN